MYHDSRAGILHDHAVRAGFPDLCGSFRKRVQLIIKNNGVQRDVHLNTGNMAQPDCPAELLRRKILGITPRGKRIDTEINRVRA